MQHAKMTTPKSNLFPILYNPYIQNFAMCNIWRFREPQRAVGNKKTQPTIIIRLVRRAKTTRATIKILFAKQNTIIVALLLDQ